MTLLSPTTRPEKLHRTITLILGAIIACRVVMMICFPHVDTSEARYAEISRKMVETGDWITPQFDYGLPFWAKPPLSMWMSALGIDLFGSNEFGSRIFIFAAAMAVLAMVAGAVRRETDRTGGLIAATLLMGMPLFFYCSAAVMTDLALVLGTTVAMTSFRAAVLENSRRHGYLFFIALAIGLLAKGPLALVLAIPPAMGWTVLTGRWRETRAALPWIGGTLLMLALALPWYIAAEIKTPGFLNYFIIGEHWKRFVIRGWQGDLYGNAHSETPGTIWLYLLMVTFPCCLGLLAIPFRKWREGKTWAMAHQGRGLYWVLWALWPIVFFTPSRNIIATYPLPALPALAILLTGLVPRGAIRTFGWKRFHPMHPALAGLTLAAVFITSTSSIIIPALIPKRTERELVKIFDLKREEEDRLLYFGIRRYSAEFYSEGIAEHTDSMETFIDKLDAPGRLFVAMPPKEFTKLQPNIQRRFIALTRWDKKRVNLYAERNDTPAMTGIDMTKTSPIGS